MPTTYQKIWSGKPLGNKWSMVPEELNYREPIPAPRLSGNLVSGAPTNNLMFEKSFLVNTLLKGYAIGGPGSDKPTNFEDWINWKTTSETLYNLIKDGHVYIGIGDEGYATEQDDNYYHLVEPEGLTNPYAAAAVASGTGYDAGLLYFSTTTVDGTTFNHTHDMEYQQWIDRLDELTIQIYIDKQWHDNKADLLTITHTIVPQTAETGGTVINLTANKPVDTWTMMLHSINNINVSPENFPDWTNTSVDYAKTFFFYRTGFGGDG